MSLFLFLFFSLPNLFSVNRTETKAGPIALPLPSLVVVVGRQPPPSLSSVNVVRRRQRTSPLRRHGLLGLRDVGGLAYSGHHGRVAVVTTGQQHLLGRVGDRVRIVDRNRKCERERKRVRSVGVETSKTSPSTFSLVIFVVSGFQDYKIVFFFQNGIYASVTLQQKVCLEKEHLCICDVLFMDSYFKNLCHSILD